VRGWVFRMHRQARFRCGQGSHGPTGLWRCGVLFLLLFVGLELCHPAADLLHLGGHLSCAEHNTAAHGSAAGEGPVLDAHGPFVLASAPLFQRPSPCRGALPVLEELPESRFLSVPSPVPIQNRV